MLPRHRATREGSRTCRWSKRDSNPQSPVWGWAQLSHARTSRVRTSVQEQSRKPQPAQPNGPSAAWNGLPSRTHRAEPRPLRHRLDHRRPQCSRQGAGASSADRCDAVYVAHAYCGAMHRQVNYGRRGFGPSFTLWPPGTVVAAAGAAGRAPRGIAPGMRGTRARADPDADELPGLCVRPSPGAVRRPAGA